MPWNEEDMCKIAAREFFNGCYANLGIGMPTKVANHIEAGMNVTLQSENGMLGMGPFPTEAEVDADLINAGKQTITELPESSYFDSALSFAMIRGGHIDVSILGALEVNEQGDLANWMVPGKMVKGPGGAMDLVSGVKRVVVLMTHNTKEGGAKFRKACSLPITGKKVVDRVITEIAVFDITPQGAVLVEHAPDVTVAEIQQRTEAAFTVADHLKKAA